MDASPTPRRATRLFLEISRSPDGRLEGRMHLDGTDVWTEFSGVLELLKVLEDHT